MRPQPNQPTHCILCAHLSILQLILLHFLHNRGSQRRDDRAGTRGSLVHTSPNGPLKVLHKQLARMNTPYHADDGNKHDLGVERLLGFIAVRVEERVKDRQDGPGKSQILCVSAFGVVATTRRQAAVLNTATSPLSCIQRVAQFDRRPASVNSGADASLDGGRSHRSRGGGRCAFNRRPAVTTTMSSGISNEHNRSWYEPALRGKHLSQFLRVRVEDFDGQAFAFHCTPSNRFSCGGQRIRTGHTHRGSGRVSRRLVGRAQGTACHCRTALHLHSCLRVASDARRG